MTIRDHLAVGADITAGSHLLTTSQRAGLRTGDVTHPAGDVSAARAVPAGQFLTPPDSVLITWCSGCGLILRSPERDTIHHLSKPCARGKLQQITYVKDAGAR